MNSKIMMRVLTFVTIVSVLAFSYGTVGCGGSAEPTPPTPTPIEVTGALYLPDGTQKSFTDRPLPLTTTIQLTFGEAVDPATVEGLLSFTSGGAAVPYAITWSEDNTVALIKPKNRLDYQTTYTIAVENPTTSESLDLLSKQADISDFSASFTSMVEGDVNGDGKADLLTYSGNWNSNTGREYLFYGQDILSGSAATADAIISGAAEDDWLWGYFAEDINDDGYADPRTQALRFSSGPRSVYIFYGGPGVSPVSGALNLSDADLIITADEVDDGFDAYVNVVADVNGDGYTDLILRASGATGSVGHVYVFFGPDFQNSTASEADVVITGSEIDGRFGGWQLLGDVNGDGIDDILTESRRYDGNRGRVYIFFGGSDLASMGEADADVVITGENPNDRIAVNALGDLDGDGIADIVCYSDYFNGNTGRVYVFYSSNLSSKSAADADVIIDGEAADNFFSQYVHIADVSGDGRNDLILDTNRHDAFTGRIYGFLGDNGLTSTSAANADFIFAGENAGDRLETIEFDFGDVNGDGITDILATSFNFPGGGNKGQGYVFFGGGSLGSKSAADADAIFTGKNDGDSFYLQYVRDINGDGVKDLICDAPFFSEINADAGRIYIFYGGSDLTSTNASDAPVKIDGEEAGDTIGY